MGEDGTWLTCFEQLRSQRDEVEKAFGDELDCPRSKAGEHAESASGERRLPNEERWPEKHEKDGRRHDEARGGIPAGDREARCMRMATHAAADSGCREQGDPLKAIGLFSGIGGLELGVARAGIETIACCEVDPAAHAVLRESLGVTSIHPDIRELDALPDGVEVVLAGFPCQDLSQAGRTRGIKGSQSSLVDEVFRLLAVAAQPPECVVLENVPFMLGLGRGAAMGHITRALTRLGYRWAYRIIDAAAFGRPQRRRRLIVVACRNGDPRNVLLSSETEAPERPREPRAFGFYWTEGNSGVGWAEDAVPPLKGGSGVAIPSAPAVWVRETGMVGTPTIEDAERLMGFRAGWTKAAENVPRGAKLRWKLVGNAVSVPLATWLGRQLRRPGSYDGTHDQVRKRNAPWPHAAWAMEDGRVRVAAASAFPVRYEKRPLPEFLIRDLEPLSVRAASGFLRRACASRLQFHPEFLVALALHIDSMDGDGVVPPRQRVAAG